MSDTEIEQPRHSSFGGDQLQPMRSRNRSSLKSLLILITCLSIGLASSQINPLAMMLAFSLLLMGFIRFCLHKGFWSSVVFGGLSGSVLTSAVLFVGGATESVSPEEAARSMWPPGVNTAAFLAIIVLVCSPPITVGCCFAASSLMWLCGLRDEPPAHKETPQPEEPASGARDEPRA